MKQLASLALIFFFVSCTERVSRQSKQHEIMNSSDWAINNFPVIDKTPEHNVLTLGVFHFDRSRDGSDVVAENHTDINHKVNQGQLDTIINKLKGFNPAAIAVEWRPEFQHEMDSLYQEYLNDNYVLGKNEAFQIGFKLAKILGHKKVFCVDNNPPLPTNVEEIDDWEVYADSLGHLNLWHAYDQENSRYNTYMDTIQKHLNIKDYLLLINSKEYSSRNKQLWTTGLVNVGYLDKYVGADLLGRWYRRNSRIYANAKNLVDQESNENLLIIYGGAHKWVLDELFDSSPDFKVLQFNELMRE